MAHLMKDLCLVISIIYNLGSWVGCGRGVLGSLSPDLHPMAWLYFTCLLLRDQIPSTVVTDHHNISPCWLLLADRAAGRVQLTAAEFQIIQREPSRSDQRSQNTQTGDWRLIGLKSQLTFHILCSLCSHSAGARILNHPP